MNSRPPDSLLGLLDCIYGAALAPEQWPSVVEAICGWLDSPKAKLFTPFLPAHEGGLAILIGIPEASDQVWATRYREHDLWLQAGMAKDLMQEGSVVLDSDLVPAEEFARSKIYREHLRLFEIGRLCSGIVFGPSVPGLHPTLLSLVRGLQKPYSEAERSRMRLLIPHLSRALGVMYRMRDAALQAAASMVALDRLASGVYILDAEGRLVHANSQGRRMIAQGMLGEANGRLVVPQASAAQWQAVLEAALDPSRAEVPHFSDMVPVRTAPEGVVLMQAAPLRNASQPEWPAQARVVVFASDTSRRRAFDAALMRELFRATAAEARLAERLCAGDTIAEAAGALGISVSTARTQLASLFEKTGTSRQADLLRALMSLQRES